MYSYIHIKRITYVEVYLEQKKQILTTLRSFLAMSCNATHPHDGFSRIIYNIVSLLYSKFDFYSIILIFEPICILQLFSIKSRRITV